MGPRRVERDEIKAFLAPELQERYFAREEFEDLPDMVGGGMTQAYYWFRRNQAHADPRALLAQLRATLKRNGFDADSALERAGDSLIDGALPSALMARILGPGRLGISHRQPEAAAVAGVLSDYARHAGVTPRQLENLLTLFAGEKLGGICLAGTPRCTACEVTFCKRLRYR
jgi:hypothetical protein